jgi:DGQHR domain-containing protein
MSETMRLPALAIEQSPGREIFSFSIDGKLLSQIAVISRIRRGLDGVSILGYQRPEVRKHISEIRDYINGPDAMVPNAVVISFDQRVEFVEREVHAGVRSGYLVVPVFADDFVGHVVDGQQRIAAIRESSRGHFPIFAVGFIASDEAQQREQFLRVNSTKPLPRGLIHELLPGVEGALPTHLQERKIPTRLLQRLNNEARSPFRGHIKTATNPSGRIADTSILNALSASLSNGLLWDVREQYDDATFAEAEMLEALFVYWGAVRSVWSYEWDLKPRQSRLTHGAGIVALSYLMEHIATRSNGRLTYEFARSQLALIRPDCHWTEGRWEFPGGSRAWNEIQNTPADRLMLSNHLVRLYKRRVS